MSLAYITAHFRKMDDEFTHTVKDLKVQYDDALAELKALLEQQQRLRAEKLLKAIAKRGRSFEEVLRLIEL